MGSEEYRKKLEQRARRNRMAFKGIYKNALNALMGLSKEEIDRITPDSNDLQTYAQLISVVKEASADNISQAELAKNIKALGKIGIDIAKKIPDLVDLVT